MAATTGTRHAIRTGGRTGKDKDMAVESIFMPDARDLDVLSVKPVRELESCNHLLDDHAALMRFNDDEGYILLRDVTDAGSVAEARKAMFAVMERQVRKGVGLGKSGGEREDIG